MIDADRIAWKRRLGRLYGFMRARDAQRRLILLYHSVGGGPEATSAAAFRDHIGIFTASGRLLPLKSLIERAPDYGVAVAITFDDGYATLRDHAAPILAQFGGAATVFLNVGEIGDQERHLSKAENGYYRGEEFLTWHDVDALLAAGWQAASHGVGHVDLATADPATVKNELCASRRQIEQRLGLKCEMFAYPWGRSNRHLRAEIRAAGYLYGLAGDHAALTAQSDPLALPRINVANEYSRDDLAAILRGDWDYLYWVGRAKAAMK